MAKVSKKVEVGEIIRCKYAGDSGDEYCVVCNGKTMEVDGQTFSCKECQAYTPAEEHPQTPTQPDETPVAETQTVEKDSYTSQGITTCIKAESGLSVETKKGWYRFSFTEERIIPETADMEKEKTALWNSVNHEVDKQLDDIMSSIK